MTNFLVVGYKGEIGLFILMGLLKNVPKALDIWCTDINETEEEIIERIRLSSIIFLCVPMDKTIDWLCKYKDVLKDKIIIEQCSKKTFIYNNSIVHDLDIRSMHILYKPSKTPNLDDRFVGLFKSQFFASTAPDLGWGSKDVLQISDDESIGLGDLITKITQSKLVLYKDHVHHDTEMATQQGLLHRIILLSGRFLKRGQANTYLGRKIIELEERIKSNGNPELYKQIQENEYLPKVLFEFEEEFKNFDINNEL